MRSDVISWAGDCTGSCLANGPRMNLELLAQKTSPASFYTCKQPGLQRYLEDLLVSVH